MSLKLYQADVSTQQSVDCAGEQVHAGFPSSVHGTFTELIDLNKELVPHPATTFYARVHGDSMRDAGIDHGDLLVIDKSLEAADGDIVVAFVDGEFTLKRFRRDERGQGAWLLPENEKYPPIHVDESTSFMIWGVVSYNIKCQLRRKGGTHVRTGGL